jgi:uncharacterized protein (DUF924 family)
LVGFDSPQAREVIVAKHCLHEGTIVTDMPPALGHRAELLLEFWFAPEGASERDRLRDIWFQASPEFDAVLAERFRADHHCAATGVYAPWREAPQTCLALILLLDQLPRNLFRQSPLAYATDAAALATARDAIARGFDRAVAPVRRCFFYLPFQHSESLADQETALRVHADLPDHPDKAHFVEAARRHHEIIARFGRFPHRNDILGRPSTREEREFLRLPGSAF